MAKHLAVLDKSYGSSFMDAPWRDVFSRSEPPINGNISLANFIICLFTFFFNQFLANLLAYYAHYELEE